MQVIRSLRLFWVLSLTLGGLGTYGSHIQCAGTREIPEDCLDENLIIQNKHKLSLRRLTPVTVDGECSCDPCGTISIGGRVAVPKKLSVSTISPVAGDATSFTNNVKVGDGLAVSGCVEQSSGVVEKNLTVCGDLDVKGQLTSNFGELSATSVTSTDTVLLSETFDTSSDVQLIIGDKRIMGQALVHVDNNVLGSEVIRITFNDPDDENVTDFAALVNITIEGFWAGHGQVFFTGEYYLSTDGLDVDLTSQGSDSIGSYAGLVNTVTRFTNSPELTEEALVEIPLPLNAYASPGPKIAALKLRTFGVNPLDPGFDGRLYYDVIGPDVASVQVGFIG